MTKEEKKAYKKQWNLDNKEKRKETNKQWYLDNKEKRKEYLKKYALDNKEEIQEYKKQWHLDNKEKANGRSKQWRLDNKEYKKQWHLDNKESINNKRRKRYHSDPLYKFKRNCRNRTHKAFKVKSWRKNGSTEKLLGCDWKTAMNHIEKQFVGKKKWMTWENHGEWHIDHNTPLASANTIEEMTPLFHYTNLQPLLAEDNIRKGDKILN
jgi:hypothetical protein|tara:strand:- start:6 stop:632 length:627 start_codon:yes stop_codon:yes gene_type:complete